MTTTDQPTATKSKAVDTQGNAEVLPSTVRLDDETLRNIGSFEDALQVMRDSNAGDTVLADAELGNGFSIADEAMKDRLVKVPLALLSWSFNEGDYGKAEDGSNVFVSIQAVTQAGEKVVINDGSTGIRAQLQAFTKRTGQQANMVVRNGLRKSEYRIDKETKKPVSRGFEGPTEPAVTYYLDTSA